MLPKVFVQIFAMHSFTQKRLCQWIARNCSIKEDLTKMTASVFHKISKVFAGITRQYMDIYHAKKQTENIPRSCSYLLLKTLIYFISQCTSVPYLESGLCKLGKELDNCNGLFSLHIEPWSYQRQYFSVVDDSF